MEILSRLWIKKEGAGFLLLTQKNELFRCACTGAYEFHIVETSWEFSEIFDFGYIVELSYAIKLKKNKARSNALHILNKWIESYQRPLYALFHPLIHFSTT